jgi:serine/threonine-protein kinase
VDPTRSAASSDGVESGGPGSVPQPGETIAGKFFIERVLGVGGMGVVVAARHTHLDQTVAIKFLRRDAARDEGAVSRFLREARAAAGLQSEHVVRVMDAGRLDDGLPFMVMEHLVGVDLDQVLVQRGRLPLDECIDYLLQCMQAVAEAHAAGIVHRDLKPSNLFLTTRPDGSRIVKVLDFGISKALDGAGRQPVNLTATSMTLGSPLYMSPEQVRSSKNVDARTDIWALGIIAYELLAGIQPFEAETVTGLCAKIVADEPEPLRTVRPDVPPAFEAVVMRCLEKNVANRFQSVSELAAALRPFASSDGLVSVSKITRIGGLRPTLASAQDGRLSAPTPIPATPVPATPVPAAPRTSGAVLAVPAVDVGAGYAETVAAWQTTGSRKNRRAVAATAGTAGGIALVVVVLLLMRGSSSSSSAPAAPTMAAGMTVGVVATSAKADLSPVTSATPPAVTPPVGLVASAIGSAPGPSLVPEAESTHAAEVPHATPSTSKHAPPARPVPTPPPSAKAPAPKSTDDLLLDRK